MDIPDLTTLSKHRLESLRKAAGLEIARRYPKRRRTPMYGLLNRGIPRNDFIKALRATKNQRLRLVLVIMAGMGTRIHETVSIRLSDIDWSTGRLHVCSQKDSDRAMPRMPPMVSQAIAEWINQGRAGKEFLFPPLTEHTKYPYASPANMSHKITSLFQRAGVTRAYGTDAAGRQRHLITSHSLRHALGQATWKETKDLLVVKRTLRHKSLKSTETYTFTPQEDADQAVAKVWG